MLKNTFKCILGLLFMFATQSEAQNTQHKIFGKEIQSKNKNGVVRCASTEYELWLQEKNPERFNTKQFEEWITPKVELIKAKQAAKTTNQTDAIITIPVVVHVIHNGDAVGVNENISDERVLSQIAVLNEDFRRIAGTLGFNSNPVGADIEIEFCMAKRSPEGTATDGINRVNLGIDEWKTESSVEESLKPSTQWDPSQYLNIWVVQFTTDNNEQLDNTLGYAQFPSNSGLGGLNTNGGDASTDGVIIDWRCFGNSAVAPGTYFSDYDRGRTATHEVGHFLGLRHIWGDNGSCEVNDNDSFKDYCPDTPAANNPNYDCSTTYDSCISAPGSDMVENYMDYTNDICMNIFTIDQKSRVLAVLQNSPRRNSLITSKGCEIPLSTESFGLTNFKLYPNPNNGTFAITFNSDSNNDIKVGVYDLSGRQIFSKSYTNSGLFSQNIQLNNLQSGMYLVDVQDGNRKEVKKIIIN